MADDRWTGEMWELLTGDFGKQWTRTDGFTVEPNCPLSLAPWGFAPGTVIHVIGPKRERPLNANQLSGETIYSRKQIEEVKKIIDLPHERMKKLLHLAATVNVNPTELASSIVSVTKAAE